MSYYKRLKKKTKEYFKILEPEFPLWLEEYIETKELLHQNRISVTCGTLYCDMFDSSYFYSSLDHSVGVALIVWHFTHDKKQTLAGLFHDIATPVFKHCVDFMNGDHETQESTEEQTSNIIAKSKELSLLLDRDGIAIDEVDDYTKYPIADNNTPRLSADRLEYSLSNSIFNCSMLSLDEIKEIYDNICIQINEDGISELGFSSKTIAKKFLKVVCRLSVYYREHKNRYSMQFVADVLKNLSQEGPVSVQDLYEKSEKQIMNIIKKSRLGKIFKTWQKARTVRLSSVKPQGFYSVKCKTKVRYIDPLVDGVRLSQICKKSKAMIDKTLKFDMSKYIYIKSIKEF